MILILSGRSMLLVSRWDLANVDRTGRILHGLGNVRCSQGRLDESEIYHRRALAQAQATVGNLHHRFADICHRVAQHCLRKGEYDHAL